VAMRKVDGGGGAVGGDLHEKQREVRWPTTGVHGGRREVSFRPAVGTRTRAAGSTLSGVAKAPCRQRLYGLARAGGSAAATRAPGGDGVPTSGPGAEKERLTGGTPWQIIPELKTILNENSSKEMAKS
jgi:hypothetical protein